MGEFCSLQRMNECGLSEHLDLREYWPCLCAYYLPVSIALRKIVLDISRVSV